MTTHSEPLDFILCTVRILDGTLATAGYPHHKDRQGRIWIPLSAEKQDETGNLYIDALILEPEHILADSSGPLARHRYDKLLDVTDAVRVPHAEQV